jgi:hypothetical protein
MPICIILEGLSVATTDDVGVETFGSIQFGLKVRNGEVSLKVIGFRQSEKRKTSLLRPF